MFKTKKLQKKGKLKAGIDEFVGPILKKFIETKDHEDYSSTSDYVDEIRLLLEKTKDVVKRKETWDSELIGCLQKIERQFDYMKENKEEGTEQIEHINDYEWAMLVNNLKSLLSNLPLADTEPHKEARDMPLVRTISEVGESSNTNNQEGDGSIQLVEYMKGLNRQYRDCLYTLGIFPENAKLKKRLLLYWWIGLGIVPSGSNADTPLKQPAEKFFSDLVKDGILKPVHTKRHNGAVSWCIVNPTIYRQLVSTCKNKGLFTDIKREECTLRFYHDVDEESKIRALLNVDQKYLNSKDITEVLSDSHFIQVVQFGQWRCTELEVSNGVVETTSKGHIEVDETEFFKILGEKVIFLCLSGISGIEKLPKSIGKLENLRILDLKACHNLEKLPQRRRSKLHKTLRLVLRQQKWFPNLTYLDISECYLLDQIPKWVCELSNLEVLKGFLVGNGDKINKCCQLGDLSKLKKLKKLGIIVAKNLGIKDLCSLRSLDNLSVLTITWEIKEQLEDSDGKKFVEVAKQSKENVKVGLKISGSGGDEQLRVTEAENQSMETVQGTLKTSGEGEIDGEHNDSGKFQTIYFPKKLEKLDIRCYFKAEAPELLNPAELGNLKRLYIRGGKLTKIENKPGWNIEILRLRYLKHLKFSWYHLSSIFTKLKCVEFEHCAKLKFFPKKFWSVETDGPFPSASDEPAGNVLLRIKSNEKAPVAENNQKMVLELAGLDFIDSRPGLDLVAVLAVSERMTEYEFTFLKSAMLLVIKKLGSIDRLSIVTLDTKAGLLASLHWMTENYKMNLRDVVMCLKVSDTTNIFDGLQMGLKIIKGRDIRCGRVSSIILLSDGKQNRDRPNAAHIPFGNVAVHTFGFGKDNDPTVLKDIAYNSMGGTFTNNYLYKYLPTQVVVCLAGLLTVAAQDLMLTISPIEKESTVKHISVGKYLQSKDDAGGSVTIELGELYSSEVRKVLVELLLPATDNKGPAAVLKIAYSYKFLNELYTHNPESIILNRMPEVSADQPQMQPEVIAEETRQKFVEIMREITQLADRKIDEAWQSIKQKIDDAWTLLFNMPREHPKLDALYKILRSEIPSLYTPEWYEDKGRAREYSFLTSHDRQRPTGRDNNAKRLVPTHTPAMLIFAKQAEKFLDDPNMPLTSIDEDLMEINYFNQDAD